MTATKRWSIFIRDRSILGKLKSAIFNTYLVFEYDQLKLGQGFMEAVDTVTNRASFWKFEDIIGWACNFDYSQTVAESTKEYMEHMKHMNNTIQEPPTITNTQRTPEHIKEMYS